MSDLTKALDTISGDCEEAAARKALDAAVKKLELRQDIFGGEPMIANESAIARFMLDAVRAIDPAQFRSDRKPND